MRCTTEKKEARLKHQKEDQKKMEEKKATAKANRIKELQAEREAAAAKGKVKKMNP